MRMLERLDPFREEEAVADVDTHFPVATLCKPKIFSSFLAIR
jgi:hypothetical protein